MLSVNVIKGKTSNARAAYYTKEYAAETAAAYLAEKAEELEGKSHDEVAMAALAAAKERTRWWGYGAKRMGLEGTVEQSDLEQVLQGKNPSNGQVIIDPSVAQLNKIWSRLSPDRDYDYDDIALMRAGRNPLKPNEAMPKMLRAYGDTIFSGDRAAKNKVSAIDLTFSASKSVSLMIATGPQEIREAAMEAHQKAVDAAMEFIRNELACVRRGAQGARQESAEDLTAALITQMSSRDNDPQVHTHAVLSAVGRGHDGRMSALNAAVLHGASRVIGSVYQAELRHQLTNSLGVSWDVRSNGLGEVKGLPVETLKKFSRRSKHIDDTIRTHKKMDAELIRDVQLRKDVYEHSLLKADTDPMSMTLEDEERVMKYEQYHRLMADLAKNEDGFNPARMKLVAQLTRRQKQELPEEVLRDEWAKRWQRDGHMWDVILDRSRAYREEELSQELSDEDRIKLFFHDLEHSLIEKDSTFSKKEAYTQGFRCAPQEWDSQKIVWMVDDFISAQGIEVQADTAKYANWAYGRGARYTTAAVMAQEKEMLERADRMLDRTDVAVCNLDTAANKSAEYTLNDEQEGLLAAMTISGKQLVVARGIAGSGKTHVLGSAASVLRTEGYQVVGLATAAATAQRLSSESGFDRSSSIDRFLILAENNRWARGASQGLLQQRELLMDKKREITAHYDFLESKATERGELTRLNEERSKALLDWDLQWQSWEKEVLAEVQAREEKGEELQARSVGIQKEESEILEMERRMESMDEDEAQFFVEELQHRKEALTLAKEAFKGELIEYRTNMSPTEKLPEHDKVVIVVDESGMVETSHYARLMALAEEKNWKIAFVGDDRQLQEVNRGGAFRSLSRLGGSIELREAMRARNKWEQEAQKKWWSSEDADSIREVAQEYLDHDKVTFIDTRETRTAIARDQVNPDKDSDAARGAARNVLKEKMLNHHWKGESSVLMASRRDDVFALNTSVQEALMEAGEVPRDSISVQVPDIRDDGLAEGYYEVHQGDRIAMLRNIKDTPMMNGMNGKVKQVYADGSLALELPTGPEGRMRTHVLDGKMVEQGVLSLGYAMTAHKAQGVSVDYGYVMGDASMNREQLYPSMTRGKISNEVVWVVDQEKGAPEEQFAGAMTKSVSKKTAMEHYVSDAQQGELMKAWEEADMRGEAFDWDMEKEAIREQKRQNYLKALEVARRRDSQMMEAHVELRENKERAIAERRAAREQAHALQMTRER